MKQALRRASRTAVLALLASSAAAVQPGHIQAEPASPQANEGFSHAIITDTPESAHELRAPHGQAYDADAPVRPHWCNTTRTLIDDIHRLGGYSVMRAEIGEGRTLERYWNASEEVVIEHGSDGTSCLVDIRRR